ncbi:hypothetical protein ACFFP0_31635 [Rhizobium puerariae]|uniref:Phage tail tape measure protein domain-containing protein n=1 Tax=Rhizobium puerariae TaxID=1585791 RepID=A0ABV6AUL2_9HYPH
MAKQAEAQVVLTAVDRISGVVKRISARLSALSQRIGFDKVTRQIANVGNAFRGLATGVAASATRIAGAAGLVGVSAGAAAAGLWGLVKNASDVGSEIGDTARKLGIGVEALQEWRWVAKQAGVESSVFDGAIGKLGVNAVEATKGNKQLAVAFKALGVRVKGAKGQMRSVDDILDDVAGRLTSIQDPIKRNQIAFKLFGKSGVELGKIFGQSADDIRKTREEARRLGFVMGADAIDAADGLGDSMDSLGARLDGLKLRIGAKLIPVVARIVDKLAGWYDANQKIINSTIDEWIQNLTGFIRDLQNPTSDIRKRIDEFANSVTSAYGAIKPFIDFLGGPAKAALAVVGLWALAPAILAVTMLAGAFLKLGAAILGFSVKALFGIGDAIATFAGKGLAAKVGAAGTTAGRAYGAAFALAARVAIIAGVAAAAMEALQVVDPKGNLGGLTTPIDNWLRDKMGLEAKDTGITPGELWQGLKNSLPDFSSMTPAAPSITVPAMPNVAAQLQLDRAIGARRFGLGGTTETEPGKAKDDLGFGVRRISVPTATPPAAPAASGDVQSMKAGSIEAGSLNFPGPLIAHEPQNITVNSPVSVTINAPPGLDANAVAVLARREVEAAGRRNAAAVKDSLSD